MAISSEKIITSRPLTHHFIQMILNDFEIGLKHIIIYKYEDGIYYAHAVLEDHFGHVKYIDCRPSDAICLALKMDKPILAAEAVFEEIQQNYADKVDDSTPLTSKETFSSSDSIILPISELDPKLIFTNLPVFLLQ